MATAFGLAGFAVAATGFSAALGAALGTRKHRVAGNGLGHGLAVLLGGGAGVLGAAVAVLAGADAVGRQAARQPKGQRESWKNAHECSS